MILASLWLAVAASGACAGDYGSLRITIAEVNPQHTTNVQLQLNGKAFASFSHSQRTSIVQDVTGDFLAKGKSTPLSSNYGKLQAGCEFNFSIQYSFDGKDWTTLGSFHAPTNAVNVSLPLGLCDGSLCSSDASVSAKLEKIEQARWEKAGLALKKWLQDGIDSQERDLAAKARRLTNQAKAAADARGEMLAAERARREMELREQVQRDEQPIEDPVAALEQQLAAAVDETSLAQIAHDLDREQKFYESCAQASSTTQNYCARYGGAGWIVATAEIYATMLSADPAAAAASLGARLSEYDGAAAVDTRLVSIARSKLRVQAVVDARRAEERWKQATAAARLGVGFSPLNDVADLCELLTGRELCIPKGRILGRDERLFAAIGVILGNREIWAEMSAEFKKALMNRFRDPQAVIKAAERMAELSPKIDALGLTHLLAGETKVVDGSTKLVSGMHADDAMQAFLTDLKREGRELEIHPLKSNAELLAADRVEGRVLHYTDENGVGLYLLPDSAFPSPQIRDYNRAELTVDGKVTRIRGAKTTFPANWEPIKIVDTVAESPRRAEVPPRPFTYRTTVDGVEVKIGVDSSGKVGRGSFPYVKWKPEE